MVAFGVRVTEVSGAMVAADRGAGLRVRDERRGGIFAGEVGGETGVGAGAGDDSFRRFAALGWPAVGEGVGRVAAAAEPDAGLIDEASEAALAGALDFADRR